MNTPIESDDPFTSSVYYTPERNGLTSVGEINLEDEPYQFFLFGVWCNDVGKLYWAVDSGCSCPTPFEDITAKDLSTGTLADLQAAVEEAAEYAPAGRDYVMAQFIDLVLRIKASTSTGNPIAEAIEEGFITPEQATAAILHRTAE